MGRLKISRTKTRLSENNYTVSEHVEYVSFKDKVIGFMKEHGDEYDTDEVFKHAYDIYCKEYGNGSDAYSVAKAMIAKYRFMKHWGEA